MPTMMSLDRGMGGCLWSFRLCVLRVGHNPVKVTENSLVELNDVRQIPVDGGA